MAYSGPAMQRIVINNHEWEVSNEPGWEEVIEKANAVREQIFRSCKTLAECSQIVDKLHTIFERYPASKHYYETHKEEVEDMISSIFKWG
ncbi:hypothetical protein I4U23_013875 [Adineta vaga]|nr:hypothetical protein I4U23_013875 [Adineta vaga]